MFVFSSIYSGCAVADPSTDSVIVIGGYNQDNYYSTNVTRYDVNGFVESLPPLNFRRVYAGCAGYYNDDENLVINFYLKYQKFDMLHWDL